MSPVRAEGRMPWAMNTVLYATWTEPRADVWMANEAARNLWNRFQKLPVNSGKRNRLKEQFKQLDSLSRIRLGHNLIVRRGHTDKDSRDGFQKCDHRKNAIKTLVAGHWKRQHYGPKASLRKWIFRQPYWVSFWLAYLCSRTKKTTKRATERTMQRMMKILEHFWKWLWRMLRWQPKAVPQVVLSERDQRVFAGAYLHPPEPTPALKRAADLWKGKK